MEILSGPCLGLGEAAAARSLPTTLAPHRDPAEWVGGKVVVLEEEEGLGMLRNQFHSHLSIPWGYIPITGIIWGGGGGDKKNKKNKTKPKNLSFFGSSGESHDGVASKQGLRSPSGEPRGARGPPPEPRVRLLPAGNKEPEHRQFPFKLRNTNISSVKKTRVATQKVCS